MDRTLKYVTDFRCIGEDCEDDCCSGWQVILDRQTHDDLRQALAAHPGPRDFEQVVRRNDAAKSSADNFAAMVLTPQKACPFLENSGLCAIHRDFGETLLSPVCSMYPRQLNRTTEGTELSLALSCPEAVRLCLAYEGSVEEVALPAKLLANPKYFISHTAAAEPATPWQRHSGLLRNIVWQLFELRDYPLSSRLFFAAFFGARLGAFLQQGVADCDENQLAAEIQQLAVPGRLDEWHEQVQGMDAPIRLPMQIILTLLVGREQDGAILTEPLRRIWQACGWPEAAELKRQAAGGELDFGAVVARYEVRRDGLEALFGDRHDMHLTNYCCNYLFRENLADAASLVAHVQNLLIRRAIVRFLLFSDPRWDEVLAQGPQAELTPELALEFEAATVEAIYKSSRATEHDPELTATIMTTLAEQNMQSLAHLVLLLRV